MNWEDYRIELRAAIEEREHTESGERRRYGMLLNADEYWRRGGDESEGRAAFKLRASGRCQKEYVTLWEIFDHTSLLAKCKTMLTVKVKEIRRANPFTTIVSCSPPGKYLLQAIHTDIEKPEVSLGTDSAGLREEKVSIHHVGQQSHDLDDSLEALTGERVLILTDVVASGSLVAYIAKLIEDLGGEPIAVLAVVLTDPDMIAEEKRTGEPPARPLGNGGRTHGPAELFIHNLTHYPIPIIGEDEYDKNKILQIDPSTMLPEEGPADRLKKPLFGMAEMFTHFQESNALAFDFFRLDAQRFTTGIRIPLLLEKFGDVIWAKISPLIKKDDLIVSTYNRTDLLLKDFLIDRLARRGKRHRAQNCVLLPLKEAISSYSYFAPPSHAHLLHNKVAVVVLTTAQEAEQLRNIASLLASHEVKGIKIICLLNRMGPHAADFVSRVRALLRGVGKNGSAAERQGDNGARFSFFSVYPLYEISANDVRQMQRTVTHLFNRYEARTKVESFKRLAKNYRKYYRTRSVTSHTFLSERPIPLGKPSRRKLHSGEKVLLKTEEGVLFFLCIDLVVTRNYAPIIEELRRIRDKSILFKLFGILLCDIQYIRLAGHFERLRDVILERVEDSWLQRFKLERQAKNGKASREGVADSLREQVDLEFYLLFGLSLFSFLDHGFEKDDFNYKSLCRRILTCGKNPQHWLRFPLNRLVYLGEDRLFWVVSLLLHLSDPDFEHVDKDSEVKRELQSSLRRFLKSLDAFKIEGDFEFFEACGLTQDAAYLRRNSVKINFNELIGDIGGDVLHSPYSVLRFLHQEIISQPGWHSPVEMTLDLVLNKLRRLIFEPFQKLPGFSENQRISFKRENDPATVELQGLLEDGMYIAGRLQEIAEATHRLFVFTPISLEHAEYFANTPESLFDTWVRDLGDLLERARVENQMSLADLKKAEDLQRQVRKALWYSVSPLQKVLRSYIVPLDEVLLSTMEEVNRQLSAEGFRDVWGREIEKLSEEVKVRKEHWEVLVDRRLLREVLRNLLLNVRYCLEEVARRYQKSKEEIEGSKYVEIRFDELETEEESIWKKRWIRLTIRSEGLSYTHQGDLETTLTRQMSEIAQYGGEDWKGEGGSFLKVEPEGKDATLATLQLRSRKEVATRLRKIEERRSQRNDDFGE